MSKHTPGPWERHEETNSVVGPKLDDKPVWLRPVVFRAETGIKPADLALICAAPDLLDALHVALRDLKIASDSGDFGVEMEPAIYQVQQAIAKATGGGA